MNKLEAAHTTDGSENGISWKDKVTNVQKATKNWNDQAEKHPETKGAIALAGTRTSHGREPVRETSTELAAR